MVRWTLEPHLKAHGISNGNQLARFARLTSPVAYRLFNGDAFERVDVTVLDALCLAFDCQPGDLLTYEAEKKKR